MSGTGWIRDPRGVEHSSKRPGKGGISPKRAAESGAQIGLAQDGEHSDVAGLAEILDAWPDLPDSTKAIILLLVQRTRNKRGDSRDCNDDVDPR